MIRQSLSSLVQTAAGSVTVEPVLVLFSLSQGIYMITSQTVYIDKGGFFRVDRLREYRTSANFNPV